METRRGDDSEEEIGMSIRMRLGGTPGTPSLHKEPIRHKRKAQVVNDIFCTFFLPMGLGLTTVQTSQEAAFGVNTACESRKEQNP